jgi:uncharacterized peroxidase-related enzyme
MRGDSELSAGEREMIAGYVSFLNGCHYCEGGHREAALALGVDATVFDSLKGDIDSSAVEDRLKPILAFARKLTENPERVGQADADAVQAAGWNEQTLSDVVNVTAIFNYFNRLVEGHGIVGIDQEFAARGRMHADEGYVQQYKEDG